MQLWIDYGGFGTINQAKLKEPALSDLQASQIMSADVIKGRAAGGTEQVSFAIC